MTAQAHQKTSLGQESARPAPAPLLDPQKVGELYKEELLRLKATARRLREEEANPAHQASKPSLWARLTGKHGAG